VRKCWSLSRKRSALLWEYRALLKNWRALLRECSFVLREYKALLSKDRAQVMQYFHTHIHTHTIISDKTTLSIPADPSKHVCFVLSKHVCVACMWCMHVCVTVCVCVWRVCERMWVRESVCARM